MGEGGGERGGRGDLTLQYHGVTFIGSVSLEDIRLVSIRIVRLPTSSHSRDTETNPYTHVRDGIYVKIVSTLQRPWNDLSRTEDLLPSHVKNCANTVGPIT